MRIFDKIFDGMLVLVIGGGVMLWDKIRAWRHPGETPEPERPPRPSKPLVIRQGVAASFLEDDSYRVPGTKEYDEVRHAVSEYPQTREGAEAFLRAMAEKKDGSWISTSVVGVADDNNGRSVREAAIKLMAPLEELNLYTRAEDHDTGDGDEDDAARDRDAGSDPDVVSVEFIGDRIGFLKSALTERISQAKDDESTRLLCFVLEVTGTSERDRGVDVGILFWQSKQDAEEGVGAQEP